MVDIIKDLCENGTILAETYAFYDVIFGPEGTIKAYYDFYGLGEPVDESMEIPEGSQDYS